MHSDLCIGTMGLAEKGCVPEFGWLEFLFTDLG